MTAQTFGLRLPEGKVVRIVVDDLGQGRGPVKLALNAVMAKIGGAVATRTPRNASHLATLENMRTVYDARMAAQALVSARIPKEIVQRHDLDALRKWSSTSANPAAVAVAFCLASMHEVMANSWT